MSDADYHFFGLGFQYYVAARCAFLAQLVPVAGNLFHHAVEMMLKAPLSQKYTMKELASKKTFSHSLTALWTAFKAEFPAEKLDEFDRSVSLLAQFETLRYPDSVMEKGASILFQWEPASPPAVPGSVSFGTPRFDLAVNDIDLLVARIFQVSSRNPQFFSARMNDYARTAIGRTNPVADFFFPINS